MEKDWAGNAKIGYRSIEDFTDYFLNEPHYIDGNHHQVVLENILEDRYGRPSLVTNRGLAAIQAAILSRMGKEFRLVCSEEIYVGSRQMFEQWHRRGFCELVVFGTNAELYSLTNASYKPTIVFAETIGNSEEMPVTDVRTLQKAVDDIGATLILDSTFTPLYTPSREFFEGEHVMVGSITKYEQEGDELSGGRITANLRVISQLRDGSFFQYAVMPLVVAKKYCEKDHIFKTVERVLRVSENAEKAARMFSYFQSVAAVWYPGHEKHVDYELARVQYQICGGVLYTRFHTARKLKEFCDLAIKLEGVNFGPSFGAKDTRLIPFYGALEHYMEVPGVLRVAMGQDPVFLENLYEILGSI